MVAKDEFIEFIQAEMDAKRFPSRFDCWNAAIKLVVEKVTSANSQSMQCQHEYGEGNICCQCGYVFPESLFG